MSATATGGAGGHILEKQRFMAEKSAWIKSYRPEPRNIKRVCLIVKGNELFNKTKQILFSKLYLLSYLLLLFYLPLTFNGHSNISKIKAQRPLRTAVSLDSKVNIYSNVRESESRQLP